jgi:hypothetical protein
MLQYATESSMLELTKVQSDIIYHMTRNQKTMIGQYAGITIAGLKKLGVNRRSAQNNVNFMKYCYLIEKIGSESHGKQDWTYFDSTFLGFLILCQNTLRQSTRRRVWNKAILKKYLPIISRNLEKISDVYQDDRDGYDFEYIFEKTANQVDIAIEKLEKISEIKNFQKLKIKFNLDFGFYDISIKSEFEFKTRKFKIPKKMGIKPEYDDRDIFLKNVADWFTFLFFFNMFQRNGSYEVKGGAIEMEIFDEILEKTEAGKKLQENYGDFINNVLDIINGDEELKQIFVNYLKLTFSAIGKKRLLKFLENNISGKPHLTFWKG